MSMEASASGRPPRRIDLAGQRYERLTALSFVGVNKRRLAVWSCQCSCGKVVSVTSVALRSGTTRSCGCLKIDKLKANAAHGMVDTRLHRIWSAMKQRCMNPKSSNWLHYGARGISVCDAWLNDFSGFASWAISHGYSDDLSIDRINNDGNYCPENCRWATRAEQAGNTTRSAILPDGRQLNEAAAQMGMRPSTLRNRLWRGWPVSDALAAPVGSRREQNPDSGIRQRSNGKYTVYIKRDGKIFCAGTYSTLPQARDAKRDRLANSAKNI